jgi:hypothetical protein
VVAVAGALLGFEPVAAVDVEPQAISEADRNAAAITSGYLVSDAPGLAGFAVAERRELDGWAADLHLPQ